MVKLNFVGGLLNRFFGQYLSRFLINNYEKNYKGFGGNSKKGKAPPKKPVAALSKTSKSITD
jgi:hypothetical protein